MRSLDEEEGDYDTNSSSQFEAGVRDHFPTDGTSSDIVHMLGADPLEDNNSRICRICFGGDDGGEQGNFFRPCKCRGTR
jgi:hypothetical protein